MEYRASGLPAVSMLDSGDTWVREHFRMAEPDAAALTAAIERMLEACSNDDRERKIRFAREFSWARITKPVVISALVERNCR